MAAHSDLVEERLREMQRLWRGLSGEQKAEYNRLTMANYDWEYQGDHLSELNRQKAHLAQWIMAEERR